MIRKKVESGPKVPGIAILCPVRVQRGGIAGERRSSEINLQSLRQNHRRGLQLEAVREDRGKSGRAESMKIIEPAQKVLPLQRKPVILDAAIKGGHFVGHVVDGNAGTEKIRREDDTPVFEPNLCVLELVAVWLFLPILITPGEVGRKTGRQFLMIFEVAKALAKFARAGHPDERGRQPCLTHC